ncbi:MAG: hypothetical protein JNM36_11630 [Chitinophagales bacterium]|nr:hypothetical protein [Chitinophagales bacterium]HNL06795.1 hypothetical protein [Chitinophagales bacterium]
MSIQKSIAVVVLMVTVMSFVTGCGKKKRCGDCPKFSYITVTSECCRIV